MERTAREKTQRVSSWVSAGMFAGMMSLGPVAFAQKTTTPPATDSAAQASPIQAAPKAPVNDAAAEGSPEVGIGGAARHSASIAPGTPIQATLLQGIDSAHLKNGQHVPAKLSAPLKTSAGMLPAGTVVGIEIVGNVPAGELTAVGEFSVELVRVGSIPTVTDVRTYRGAPGKREVADAAPALGTNAGLPAGAAIEFRVSKPAVAATDAPKGGGVAPGSVDTIAVGSPAQKKGSNSGEPTYGGGASVLNQPASR